MEIRTISRIENGSVSVSVQLYDDSDNVQLYDDGFDNILTETCLHSYPRGGFTTYVNSCLVGTKSKDVDCFNKGFYFGRHRSMCLYQNMKKKKSMVHGDREQITLNFVDRIGYED